MVSRQILAECRDRLGEVRMAAREAALVRALMEMEAQYPWPRRFERATDTRLVAEKDEPRQLIEIEGRERHAIERDWTPPPAFHSTLLHAIGAL